MNCIDGVKMNGLTVQQMDSVLANINQGGNVRWISVGAAARLPRVETRVERLARLKTAIKAGRYFVSSKDIAECLMRSMRRGE
jgi:anti-sigma28 factor (negative regulator of flagellin synthesis)